MNKSILVIFGGKSSEYEIACKSAAGVITGLENLGYKIHKIGMNQDGKWLYTDSSAEQIANDTWQESSKNITFNFNNKSFELEDKPIEYDFIFPITHGKYGEDGTLQGFLELFDLPYIGCKSMSSALCMDKYRSHKLVEAFNIKTAKSYIINEETVFEDNEYPLIVKPCKAGSSLGISKVNNNTELHEAYLNAVKYDDVVIAEEFIKATEVGCAIIGSKNPKIGVVDAILCEEEIFDYTEKYHPIHAQTLCPAPFNDKLKNQIKETALSIYNILGCEDFARVDLFLTDDNEIYFNEINTIPGFTATSRFPSMFKALGLTFEEVLDTIIKEAKIHENN